jgi:hypothetical protein
MLSSMPYMLPPAPLTPWLAAYALEPLPPLVPAAANGSKGVSDAEVAAAMRAAEDEGDAEAALLLEKETAADMAEFTQVC